MSRETVPKFVPLPEVENYTDRISLGALGLPVGFDEKRLGLNVRAVERIAQ